MTQNDALPPHAMASVAARSACPLVDVEQQLSGVARRKFRVLACACCHARVSVRGLGKPWSRYQRFILLPCESGCHWPYRNRPLSCNIAFCIGKIATLCYANKVLPTVVKAPRADLLIKVSAWTIRLHMLIKFPALSSSTFSRNFSSALRHPSCIRAFRASCSSGELCMLIMCETSSSPPGAARRNGRCDPSRIVWWKRSNAAAVNAKENSRC